MKYKQSINGFVEAMAGLVEQNASGHVVLITEAGDWGKLTIHHGEIHAVGLGEHRGPEVLDYIQPMDSIQYMFRPARESELNNRPQPPGSATMNSDQFFHFFDHVLPKIFKHHKLSILSQRAKTRKIIEMTTISTRLMADAIGKSASR